MTQNTADFEKKARFKRKLRSVVSVLLVFVSIAITIDIIREGDPVETTSENNQYNVVVEKSEAKENVAQNDIQNAEIKNIQNKNEEVRVSEDAAVENIKENATFDASKDDKNGVDFADIAKEEKIDSVVEDQKVQEQKIPENKETVVEGDNVIVDAETKEKKVDVSKEIVVGNGVETAKIESIKIEEKSLGEKESTDEKDVKVPLEKNKLPQIVDSQKQNTEISSNQKIQKNTFLDKQPIENSKTKDIVESSLGKSKTVEIEKKDKDEIDIHIVVIGDFLSDIVKKKYGTSLYVNYIAAFNNIENADFIKPDTLVYLPSVEYLQKYYPIKKQPEKTKITKEEELNANFDLSEYYFYIVKEGDNLSKIAKIFKMKTIELLSYNENLKKNPNLIKTNDVLKIPKTNYLMASNKD